MRAMATRTAPHALKCINPRTTLYLFEPNVLQWLCIFMPGLTSKGEPVHLPSNLGCCNADGSCCTLIMFSVPCHIYYGFKFPVAHTKPTGAAACQGHTGSTCTAPHGRNPQLFQPQLVLRLRVFMPEFEDATPRTCALTSRT